MFFFCFVFLTMLQEIVSNETSQQKTYTHTEAHTHIYTVVKHYIQQSKCFSMFQSSFFQPKMSPQIFYYILNHHPKEKQKKGSSPLYILLLWKKKKFFGGPLSPKLRITVTEGLCCNLLPHSYHTQTGVTFTLSSIHTNNRGEEGETVTFKIWQ